MLHSAPIGPYELRIEGDRLRLYRRDLLGGDPAADVRLELTFPTAGRQAFTPVRFDVEEQGFWYFSHIEDRITLDIWIEEARDFDGLRMRLRLQNISDPMTCRLTAGLQALAGDSPRWMIPGIFYKYNRVEKCQRLFPAYERGVVDPGRMTSNLWRFRSDRAATPAVFAWTSRLSAAVLTEERVGVTDDNRLGIGMTGLYFRSDEGSPEIGLQLPYLEEPARFSFCHPEGPLPEETWILIEKGLPIEWEIALAIHSPDLHAYHRILRAQSERSAPANAVKPWLRAEEAETLTAESLMTWHASPFSRLIFETAVFDKCFGRRGTHISRPMMHTGWTSGAPVALALLWRGHEHQEEPPLLAGRAILDKIAEERTPHGLFWPEWIEDEGWNTGLNPEETWIHARTLADAVLHTIRALRLELLHNQSHPQWLEAIRTNLDYVVSRQRGDGALGTCYDCETGEVTEWEGSAGAAWIGALAAAVSLLHDSRYRECARQAAEYYARFIEDEFLYGAAEDHYLIPTCEDGYCALVSYLLLYELDHAPRWLDLARRAADWALTFRYTYNVVFPRTTLLGHYDFKTRGGDAVSPASHALRGATLGAYAELLKLATYTGDSYYQRAAEEARIHHLQFIAREDGDFGARRGMTPNQFHQTDWQQPKGGLLTISHSIRAAQVLTASLASRLISLSDLAARRAAKMAATAQPAAPARSAEPVSPGGTRIAARGAAAPAPAPGAGASPARPQTPTPPAAKPPATPPPARPATPPVAPSWITADPRETQDIEIKWKIF